LENKDKYIQHLTDKYRMNSVQKTYHAAVLYPTGCISDCNEQEHRVCQFSAQTEAEQIQFHGFLPSIYWPDRVSNVSTLRHRAGNGWILTSVSPKMGSRMPALLWWLDWHYRCVPGLRNLVEFLISLGPLPPHNTGTGWQARHNNNNNNKFTRSRSRDVGKKTHILQRLA